MFRRRIPFLGIFLSAMAGILFSAHSTIGVPVFLSGALAGLAVWLAYRREIAVYVTVAMVFAAVQALQTRASVSMRFCELVGAESCVGWLRGHVIDDPQPAGTGGSRFVVRAQAIEIGGSRWSAPVDVLVIAKGSPPAPDDLIEARGSFSRVPEPRNPGEFNARRFYALQGIHNEFKVSYSEDWEVVEQGSPYSLQRIAASCRRWMAHTLSLGISDQPLSRGLLAGIVLGDTGGLPESLETQFRDTGTFHLFSVSGLHVGMIAVILWQLAKTAGIGRRAAVALIVPSLFFYALVTGWKPASIRAATMATIILIGMLSSRQPVALNSLCAAGTAILAHSTNELFNPGVQFSFSVVLAIILIAGPLQIVLRRRLEPDAFLPVALWGAADRIRHAGAGFISGLAAVSFAAWIGSIPLTAGYFHMVSLSALITNPVAVPLAFVVMVTAMLALGGGLASAWIASVFNNANLVFTHALLAIVNFTAALPGSTLSLAAPSGPLRVTVFDFGRGGSAAIESGGTLWLLDAGSRWNAESTLLPWMRSVGRRSPDGLVVSHGDASHIAGLSALLERPGAPVFVDSTSSDGSSTRRALHRLVESMGISKTLVHSGDQVVLSPGTSLAVLHPPLPVPAGIADDKVLVARLDEETTRILFLSDAGPVVWERLLASKPSDLRADVLVLGRHDSGVLPDATFLKTVGPKIVVVTVAGFPRSEHIDHRWEDMVRGLGIEVLRQDRTGAVEIRVGKEGLKARGFLDGRQLEFR